MNLSLNSCTKQSQLYNKRQKPTQRMMGEISQKVRDKVNARTSFAPIGCCERCKKNRNGYWTLEQAHIDSRGSISHKTTEFDLARLCGPSTQSGTCHFFAHTGEGKAWMYEFQDNLLKHLEEAQ
jgi:hypothetical protein